ESIKMSHGNVELFDIFAPVIEPKTEFSDEEKMKQEYEATGFYFTYEQGEKYNELRKDSKNKYLNYISKGTYVRKLVTVEDIKSKNRKKLVFTKMLSKEVSIMNYEKIIRLNI